MIIREYRIPIPDFSPFDAYSICQKVCVKYGGKYSGPSQRIKQKKTSKGYNRYEFPGGYVFRTRRAVVKAEAELKPLMEELKQISLTWHAQAGKIGGKGK